MPVEETEEYDVRGKTKEDAIQNTQFKDLIRFLNLKFEVVGKDIARNDGKLTIMEEKNCRKHQEILATVNNYQGKMEGKIEQLERVMVDREKFDHFIESNNGKLYMLDKRCEKSENELSKYKDKVLWLSFIVSAGFGILFYFRDYILKRL